jgi:hypothetical protein
MNFGWKKKMNKIHIHLLIGYMRGHLQLRCNYFSGQWKQMMRYHMSHIIIILNIILK